MDNVKRKISRIFAWSILVWEFFIFCISPTLSFADLSQMSDYELSQITGQGTTNLYIEDNTVRLFLDVHIETYGEIDSIKGGYYAKTDFNTHKNHIGYPDETNGNYSYVKDSNGVIVIEGNQGSGVNTNTRDWDLNWKNVTLGESYDAPLVVDGLVVRAEFDDINSADKRLKKIIIGTNNMVGQISGDFIRTTGAVHPDVPMDNTNTLSQLADDALTMNRDSILQNYDALNIDGGFFMELNLDNLNPSEQGIKTIIGYRESAAVAMTFTGADWWHQ